jgi:hypothetical protein
MERGTILTERFGGALRYSARVHGGKSARNLVVRGYASKGKGRERF